MKGTQLKNEFRNNRTKYNPNVSTLNLTDTPMDIARIINHIIKKVANVEDEIFTEIVDSIVEQDESPLIKIEANDYIGGGDDNSGLEHCYTIKNHDKPMYQIIRQVDLKNDSIIIKVQKRTSEDIMDYSKLWEIVDIKRILKIY